MRSETGHLPASPGSEGSSSSNGWIVSERIKISEPWRGFRSPLDLFVFRLLVLATLFFGSRYLVWRYSASLNTNALWFALPLILAETYSVINSGLFAINLWRPLQRKPPQRKSTFSVDVFITTCNEPPEIVRKTAEAAVRITHPHRTYILDDGRSPPIAAIADGLKIGYISRSDNRHAKAGNINNALRVTDGDLILYLDADQIPSPRILDRVLGYFEDERVAFVQTPQEFYNVPACDPFGNDADLFYGPIQQGKDSWNAAFLCGTNVVLRREALIQMGLIYYVKDMQAELAKTMRAVDQAADEALRELEQQAGTEILIPAETILRRVHRTIRESQVDLKEGVPLEQVIARVGGTGDELARLADALSKSRTDMLAILRDLGQMGAGSTGGSEAENARVAQDRISLDLLPAIERIGSAIEVLQAAAQDVSRVVDIEEMPMATISITEDLATSVRLHALGWKSVYHKEVLARGLAPEDLATAIKQRKRWAQGTLQVMAKENPITKPGLTFGQRLQYFTTMFSYFHGFTALIFLIAPIIPLFTGIAPVKAYTPGFFIRLVPYLLLNQIMFGFATRGISTWRGQQYQLALFPIWIGAILSAPFKKVLKFNVTPKTRQSGVHLRLIKPQLAIMMLTLAGIVVGGIRLISGLSADPTSILVNIFWGSYNLWMLSAIVRGALWNPDKLEQPSSGLHDQSSARLFELAGGFNHASSGRKNIR